MTVKERIIERLAGMDETQLLKLEKELDELEEGARIERQLEALKQVAGIISDPEDVAALEQATRRRPFFGGPYANLECR